MELDPPDGAPLRWLLLATLLASAAAFAVSRRARAHSQPPTARAS
jgi:hypothetical protein